MILIPDDAVDRLFEAARKIGTHCEKMSVPEWEIYATQGYGHSLDIEAGRAVGCKTVLVPEDKVIVKKEMAESDINPDYICDDFYSGVEWIIENL